MKVKVLASGSKGNSTYVECGNVKILIDAGIGFLQIKSSLANINVDINDIDMILITHVHSDHIKGLASLLKRTKIKLFCTSSVYEDLYRKMEISKFHLIEDDFIYKGIEIETIPLSHDVPCYSFKITHDGKTLVYITDTGYLNKKLFERIRNKDIYIMETNHDEKMLMEGPYPFVLKQRILSDRGHLSNSTASMILTKIIGKRTKYIFLAHISEHNNTKELALEEIKNQFKKENIDFDNFIVTDQYVALDMVEV